LRRGFAQPNDEASALFVVLATAAGVLLAGVLGLLAGLLAAALLLAGLVLATLLVLAALLARVVVLRILRILVHRTHSPVCPTPIHDKRKAKVPLSQIFEILNLAPASPNRNATMYSIYHK
jgi:hypothetical protein